MCDHTDSTFARFGTSSDDAQQKRMPTRTSAPSTTTQRTSKSNARLSPYKPLIEPTPKERPNAMKALPPAHLTFHRGESTEVTASRLSLGAK